MRLFDHYLSTARINGANELSGILLVEQVANHLILAAESGFNVQADHLGFTVTMVDPSTGDLYVYEYEGMYA